MKKTFIAMLAVTVLLLALALTINYVLLWRLFLASSLILLAGAAWTFIGSRGVHGSVTSLPDHCQAGDALEQVVTLQNRGPLLKLLEVAPTGDLPGPDGIMVMALDPGSEERLQSRLTCERRGIFRAFHDEAGHRGITAHHRVSGHGPPALFFPAVKEQFRHSCEPLA
jgi:uncharacterized protein (DUF58 family)